MSNDKEAAVTTLVETKVGRIRAETHPELGIFLHVDIYEWNREAVLEAEKTFEVLVENCRRKGIEKIFASIPDSDPKNEKFAALFGFMPTELRLNTDDGQYVGTVWEYEV